MWVNPVAQGGHVAYWLSNAAQLAGEWMLGPR